MLLGSRSAWPSIFALGVIAIASCSGNEDDATPVRARPGITQPEPGGATLDENEACRRITDAEEARRQTLMCDRLVHAPCPVYVRPAGTGCWTYSEDSVSACEAAIRDYSSCVDFDQRQCVLSAVRAAEGSCPAVGAGGAGPGAGGGGGDTS
jgi:hypothetical protein